MFARSTHVRRTVAYAALSAMLTAQTAWAHTTSIGYEGAGPGTVNFWYGSYHNTPGYTEGSLRLDGASGFSLTSPFTLLVYTKPAGLIDGTTNFYTNGTALTGDPAYSRGEVSWQGVAVGGLRAGTYTFTYVPISNPTSVWRPWDSVILSGSVTLSAALIGGSAFQPNSTATSSGAAGVLDAITSSATGAMAGVITTLQGMDAKTQAAALQRIAPETSSALGMASSQVVGGVLDTVAVRLDGLRAQSFTTALAEDLADGRKVNLAANGETSGLISGDPSLRHSFWVKAFGAHGDQDMKDSFAGYKAETGGMALGSDMLLPNKWVVGGAFTYAYTDVSMADFRSGDGAKIDSYQLTSYATRDFGRWYAEGILAYARQNYKTSRDTVIAGIAHGDFSGNIWGTRVGVGMPFPVGEDLTLTPMVGLEYSHLTQDGYTETDAGPLSMQVQGATADRLRSSLGVKLAAVKPWNGYTIRPSMQVGWRHEFISDGIDSTATFTGGGATFQTAGQDLPRDSLNLGVGMSVSKSDNFLVSVQLDTEQANGYSAYAGQVFAQWKF